MPHAQAFAYGYNDTERMPARLLNARNLKAGWAGLTEAVRAIAVRTDRAVQLARLRLTLWELDRELLIAYRELGQRLAELVLTSRAAGRFRTDTVPADDPASLQLLEMINRLRSRMEHLTQQIAALNLEAPDESILSMRRRLQAAGLTEVVAVIARRSPHAHKRLSDVRPTAECIVTTMIRNGSPFVPTGDSTLLPGDELVLFGPAVACERAKLFFERTAEGDYPQQM